MGLQIDGKYTPQVGLKQGFTEFWAGLVPEDLGIVGGIGKTTTLR